MSFLALCRALIFLAEREALGSAKGKHLARQKGNAWLGKNLRLFPLFGGFNADFFGRCLQ